MSIDLAVKKRVKELCKNHKISYHKLSQQADLNYNTINNFMIKEGQNLSIYSIYRICLALNISLSEFFASDVFKEISK